MNPQEPPILETTGGDFPLVEYRFGDGERSWSVLHTGAVLSDAEETHVIENLVNRLPYGVALWPSAIALAHEIADRPGEFRGAKVLELGAGVGLPGIVAATLGGRVVQTDRDELALRLCRRNGERNEETEIDYRRADWSKWEDTERYDWILGADVLYAESQHGRLREIFERNLAPGGRALISDPFRSLGLPLLEAMSKDGWRVAMARWDVGIDEVRPIAVFELTPRPSVEEAENRPDSK